MAHFQAVGVDDDSAMTMASIDIRFTNINPHGLSVTMTNESGPLPLDVQQTWHVQEDQIVNLAVRRSIQSMTWMA